MVRLSALFSLGISFCNLIRNVIAQNMRKMTHHFFHHQFFHDASILVSVGAFLVHRFETVDVSIPAKF